MDEIMEKEKERMDGTWRTAGREGMIEDERIEETTRNGEKIDGERMKDMLGMEGMV
jgi:hypothetical protein